MSQRSSPIFKTFRCNKRDLSALSRIIQSGGVVVFPTDTVYGIGCNPYDDHAVSRIFTIKGRKSNKSLPVLTDSLDNAENLVHLLPMARALALHFWPGALTIVAPLKDKKISRLVTAGSHNLAVRVPANKCLLSLLDRVKFLVGTSANKSGQSALSDGSKVLTEISGFDALLEGGAAMAVESTIIDFAGNIPIITREGAIPANEIMAILKLQK